MPFERLAMRSRAERWVCRRRPISIDAARARLSAVFAASGRGRMNGSLADSRRPTGSEGRAPRGECEPRREGVRAGQYAWAHGRDPRARGRPASRSTPWRNGRAVRMARALNTVDRRHAEGTVGFAPFGRAHAFGGCGSRAGRAFHGSLNAGFELRREARATLGGFSDQGETRALSGLVRSPNAPPGGRDPTRAPQLSPLATPQRTLQRSRGREASESETCARVDRARRSRGVRGGESRASGGRVRGTGAGAYDSLGNFGGPGTTR